MAERLAPLREADARLAHALDGAVEALSALPDGAIDRDPAGALRAATTALREAVPAELSGLASEGLYKSPDRINEPPRAMLAEMSTADPRWTRKDAVMQAITVRDRDAGVDGLALTDMPYPHAAENDVIVRVHAAGFTPGELAWPGTWVDRAGRDRTPSVPGHELSGVVVELGYGTTGLTVGQRVFGLIDWSRNGSLAEYAAVEARNLAPLPADVDHVVAAALPISGLTAWQGLFDHARLATGQTVLIHGAAGGVGSIAVQLAREVGAVVIGTGRAVDRDTALGLGMHGFLDLQADKLEEAGEVDVVFDVIGGDILDRSAALVRAGGTLVTIAGPPTVKPKDGRAIFFVVEPDRSRLADLAQRLRDGRLKPIVGAVRPLAEAPAAFVPGRHVSGKTIIRIIEGG